ncbi:MAG TPA: (2Fe-2S)-binding protein [Wenzhouxiangella sp.]|nr:(2Fe-2S)-binding protein [Wenzhouxiangella sp.]
MYVCICNAVTEAAIRALVAQGCDSLDEVQALTGCSGTCGSCREHAEAVIQSALSERAATTATIPISTGSRPLPIATITRKAG